MSELLSVTRGLKDSYSLSNKQKKNVSSHGSPCILIHLVSMLSYSYNFKYFVDGQVHLKKTQSSTVSKIGVHPIFKTTRFLKVFTILSKSVFK